MVTRDEAMRQCYSIPGMLWPSEQGWIYDTFASSRVHAEIGVFCGRSLLATCHGMKQPGIVYAVDSFSIRYNDEIWQRRVWEATADLIERTTHVRVGLYEMTSLDAFRQLSERKVVLDSVFIDACHQYAECKADIEMWSTLVKPGGIVSGHDYWPNDVGVMDAVNETGPFSVAPETRIWWRKR